jgi:tRNA(Ile)-lysidine synthase
MTMYFSSMRGNAKASRALARVMRAIESLPRGRYLLAVSGGRDSMVLLDAFSRSRHDHVTVATFDHATGDAAERAVHHVARVATRLGHDTVSGRRDHGGPATEAAWRGARWSFLREQALQRGAAVVTAHTRDDQLETVVMRALRDSRHTSTRGLAAMYASVVGSRREDTVPVVRPLLDVARADVAAYAAIRRVDFVDDPTNASRRHLRNRVRLDLLPALERVSPGFGRAMLRLSRAAAIWRSRLDDVVEGLGVARSTPGAVVVAADELRRLGMAGWTLVWPALAERAGVVLDRRGTERLVAFTGTARPGGKMPLSGGAGVECTGRTFVLRTFVPTD